MSIPKIDPRNLVLVLIIVIVAALRVAALYTADILPIAMFTPIGAMALFGGAYFRGSIKPYAFPLLTLFASDLILSFTLYSEFRSGLLYPGWFWTYAAFALMAVAGKFIITKVTVGRVLVSVITATLIHWLVSDIGGCLQGTGGLPILSVYADRLITAIPYEFRFLGGTVIYSAIMFGSFELLKRRYVRLAGSV
jgi:hypothetical protein